MLAIITSHPIQYQAPLWRALAAAGVNFEVWFLTPHAVKASHDREFGQTFAWDVDLLEGYPHRFLEVEPGWRLDRFNGIKLRRAWADELRSRQITTVWIEGWRFLAFWQVAAAAKRAGLSVWLRGESHDLAPEPGGPRRWLKHAALGWLFRRIDHFLCIGSANRRFYHKHGIPSPRLASAPYCVDNDRFARAARSARADRAALRQHWNLEPDAYVVLFCGKLIDKKRPLDLVTAAQDLDGPAGRPLRLLFAGDGELRATIQNRLDQAAGPRGTITGFLNQSQIPNAFAAADCLVLPSDYGETWGLVVNEALACGLPVVVSNRCGCAEDLAAPLGPGHVFPCGDIAALRRSLEGLLTHPPSHSALQALSDSHSPAQTVATVSTLLRSSLSHE